MNNIYIYIHTQTQRNISLSLSLSIYHHHHHVVRLAQISQTLFLHVSLSFIASGRSSRLHPVSSHSCCMNVRAGRPAFDWSYAGVHRSTSLTISSLLLQQCPACKVFVICGRWPYSWRLTYKECMYYWTDIHTFGYLWFWRKLTSH